MKSVRWTLAQSNRVLIKRGETEDRYRHRRASCEHEVSHLQIKDRELEQIFPSQPSEGRNCQDLDLDKFQLFNPACLWYFVNSPRKEYCS